MFDAICILAAGLLAASCIEKYKFLAMAVFVEFSLHQIIYQGGIVETSLLNPWLIYLSYATIQLFVMAYLYLKKSHFIITGLIFINFVYNLVATYYGYKYWVHGEYLFEFNKIYFIYPYFIGTIMLFELTYLGWLSRYVYNYRANHGKLDTDHIDRLFCVRGWHINRSLS